MTLRSLWLSKISRKVTLKLATLNFLRKSVVTSLSFLHGAQFIQDFAICLSQISFFESRWSSGISVSSIIYFSGASLICNRKWSIFILSTCMLLSYIVKTQSLFKTLECLRLLCHPTYFGHTLDHLQGMFLVQCWFPPCCFVTILLGYVAVSSVLLSCVPLSCVF